MHTVHSGFSVVASLDPDKEEIVKNILAKFHIDPENKYLPFSKSLSTLSASGIVVPAQKYCEETLPATLLLFTSYCGPFNNHLNELIRFGGKGLRQLFEYSIDFPSIALTCDRSLKKFLIKHRSADTFYSGIHHISSTDIKREEELRTAISEFLYQGQLKNIFNDLQPEDIRKQIQYYINNKGEAFLWARNPVKKTLMDYWILFGPAILPALIVCCLLVSLVYKNGVFFYLKFIAIFIIFSIIFVAIKFRLIEMNKTQKIADMPNYDRLKIIASSQNNLIINEMTAAGPLKKGRIRRIVLRSLLKIISIIRWKVKIATIVSARWLSINNGKRLVFISNYANMSESYVRDFIDSTSSRKGINLLFGHCEGYPPTKWLIGEGATNMQGFMNVVQTDQHIAQLWYCPYKNLSVDNIINNRKIRNGLFAKLSQKQIKDWLHLL